MMLEGIEQHHKYMRQALDCAAQSLRTGDVPIGAIIVHEGRVIGKGWNQVEKLKDASAHAEMIAISSASDALQQKYLNGATLYVTIEPCTMCAGAIELARISKVIFGAQEPKTGACGSIRSILSSNSGSDSGSNASTREVYGGILEDECAALMKTFFQGLRHESKEDE
jgi:tRNA(adenine34) deaminase